MVGEGFVIMDVCLFVACVLSMCLNLQRVFRAWIRRQPIPLVCVLRATGWAVIGARFASVLFVTGDLAVSVPAAIGIFFFAAAGTLTARSPGQTKQ